MVDKLAGNPTIFETSCSLQKRRWKLLKAGACLPNVGWVQYKKRKSGCWVIYGITFGWLARIKIHYRDSLWSMLWNGMSYSRFVVRCSGGILLHGLIFYLDKIQIISESPSSFILGCSSCSHNHGSGKWVPPIWVAFRFGPFSTEPCVECLVPRFSGSKHWSSSKATKEKVNKIAWLSIWRFCDRTRRHQVLQYKCFLFLFRAPSFIWSIPHWAL